MPSASSLHSRFKGDVPVDGTPMFVCGVNQQTYEGQTIASNASSTTKCLAPVAQVLNDKWASNAAS